MQKNKIARVVGFIGAAGLSVGLIGAAGAATGAYFTDSDTGQVSGTVGSILISPSGADLDLQLGTVLPGDVVEDSTWAKNDGNSAQDVWVQFPSQITMLGSYASVSVNGQAITSGDPVRVAQGVAPGASVELKLRLAVSGDIDNIEGGLLLNGDGATTDRSGSVSYTVIATQVDESPV